MEDKSDCSSRAKSTILALPTLFLYKLNTVEENYNHKYNLQTKTNFMRTSILSLILSVFLCYSVTVAQEQIPYGLYDLTAKLILEREMANHVWPSNTELMISDIYNIEIAEVENEKFYIIDLDVTIKPMGYEMMGSVVISYNTFVDKAFIDSYHIVEKEARTPDMTFLGYEQIDS